MWLFLFVRTPARRMPARAGTVVALRAYRTKKEPWNVSTVLLIIHIFILQKSSSHLPPYMRLHIIIGPVVDKEPDLAARDHDEEHRV